MSVQPYLIAPFETGKQTDMQPWLLPDEAFPDIEDAYVFRKRIKRRPGNKFVGRLVQQTIQIYPLAVAPHGITWTNVTGVDNVPIRPFSVTITINTDTFNDDGAGGFTGSGTGTIDYNTGIISLAFADIGAGGPYNVSVTYSYYPNTSVMGLPTKEKTSITVEDTIAFNLAKSNIYNTGTGYFDDISFYDHSDAPTDWNGEDYNFFDAENYQGAMFATNNVPGNHVQNIVSTAKGATTTFTFTSNVLAANDQVFIKNLVPAGTDTLTTLQNLNDNSFKITSATQTTITIPYDSSGFNANPTGGTAFMPQHSGYINPQFITGITPGPTTTITFAANTIILGQIVYIEWVDGTIGAVLNNMEFVVTGSSGSTITIDVVSTGLTWGTTAGLVVVPQGDGIRFYANDTSVDGWVNFNPPINNANSLKGARILLGYKDRLLTFSTYEGTISGTDAENYTNRARWSQNGTVYYSTPVPLNQTADGLSWRDDIPGKGGYVDAPTSEAIVSAEFIRDTLIVFFERSTWALRYTADPTLPFIWARINVEFGSTAQFSTVPFDRGVLAVGIRGIVSADGNNVARIDLKIPDEVFGFMQINNNDMRIHGIRDYFNELVYFTYIDNSTDNLFPNKLLVYNYRENSYSNYNDSYTCFGYWTEASAYLWNTADVTWDQANFNWNAIQTSQDFPSIIAGTNTGYVMQLGDESRPSPVNDTQISIANITNAASAVVTTNGSHNLQIGQYVTFQNVLGMEQINSNIGLVLSIGSATTFTVDIDTHDITVYNPYTYAGDIIRINNFSIYSKQFNPFVKTGRSVFLSRLEVYADYVPNGQITINTFINSNTNMPINVAQPGQPQFWQYLIPLDDVVNLINPIDQIWIRMNAHIRGQFIQLQLTLSDSQMRQPTINRTPFVLHGLILWMGTGGRLVSR